MLAKTETEEGNRKKRGWMIAVVKVGPAAAKDN